MDHVKSHFSVGELAAFKLDGLPHSRQNMLAYVERNCWSFIEVKAKGGVRKEYAPPESILAQIRARAMQGVLNEAKTLPVPPSLLVVPDPVSGQLIPADQQAISLTSAGTLQADCRKGILLAIEKLMAGCGVGKEAAIAAVLVEAKKEPDGQLARTFRLAADSRGRKGDGLPNPRTIKRWFKQERETGTTASKRKAKDMSVPAWAPAFLAVYQTPQKPSIAAAYRIFSESFTDGVLPSEHAVRRFLNKMGSVSREMGRLGTREIKNIKPFVRRTFDELMPADVYSADGHCFDAEVRHPLTGKPFRPEITSIIDIASRRLVGFSVDLAESGLAVVDALRFAATNAAVCSIFYVDNGSGYQNAMMKDEATGLVSRLGIEMLHSLPYNSQARGVIERVHQTIWVAAAKELPTFIGKDMDRQAGQSVHKITRKALKNGGAQPLMAWADFMAFCHRKVNDYNNRPHKSLGGKTPNQVWAEHAAVTRLHQIPAAEAETLFHPMATRKVARGEVQLFNNKYFSHALEELHGEFVRVAYDVHNAEHVWIYDRDGKFVCKATWGANEAAYFPQPVIEQARIKREEGRLKRLELKADDVREALSAPMAGQLAAPTLDITQAALSNALRAKAPLEPIELEVSEQKVTPITEAARPLFTRAAERYRWLMAHRAAWTEADQVWIEDYVQSDDYQQRVDMFEVECIAWQGNALGGKANSGRN